MCHYFKNASWIWICDRAGADEYGEFSARFSASAASAVCRISCDGDYTLFVNGEYAASNQYGDFEHYKIFDEIDVTAHLRAGVNEVSVLVWYFGVDSQRYKTADAGLIFEIEQAGEVLLSSGEQVLCRKSAAYPSGRCKAVTYQLGLSFLYDATQEDTGEWRPSVVVNKVCDLYPRPTEKLKLLPPKDVRVLKNEGSYYLIDLGEETVGLPTLEFDCAHSQKILVAWGEDLQDGHVRRIIGGRDFSFEYVSKAGNNRYTNYMLRLGCRYMELYAEAPIELRYLGLIPQVYPVERRRVSGMDPLDRRIYDVCVKTLELCMMEHYVDTPWREQCLYAFDSRNQMLCGYRAFEGGNAAYARANLLLMGKDRRSDGLLSICSPCGVDLVIPSFSLYYFIAVREYMDYTKDVSLGKQVYAKLVSLAETFLKNREDGLILRFGGDNQWNFYDWSEHLSGSLWKGERATPDVVINSLFILALESLRVIAQAIGERFLYGDVLEETRARARAEFYDAQSGAFFLTRDGGELTVLGNALAILAGLADSAQEICEQIAQNAFSDCSLSMRCFKYDAMLATDVARWRPYVVEEIRRDYSRMLDAGATSVWETAEGAPAFGSAGSLCHGWSAIPICYL
ncbi:MAG: hypothetical protein IJW29_09815 [Clostridia bacterium]|nr:hypothetical protein [Clostridia bacterium]